MPVLRELSVPEPLIHPAALALLLIDDGEEGIPGSDGVSSATKGDVSVSKSTSHVSSLLGHENRPGLPLQHLPILQLVSLPLNSDSLTWQVRGQFEMHTAAFRRPRPGDSCEEGPPITKPLARSLSACAGYPCVIPSRKKQNMSRPLRH